jgi:hypothetical protein
MYFDSPPVYFASGSLAKQNKQEAWRYNINTGGQARCSTAEDDGPPHDGGTGGACKAALNQECAGTKAGNCIVCAQVHSAVRDSCTDDMLDELC